MFSLNLITIFIPYLFVPLPTIKDLKLILLHYDLSFEIMRLMFYIVLVYSMFLQELPLGIKNTLFTEFLRRSLVYGG